MKLLKAALQLCIGGALYYGIELLYRGYSHISMFILGGIIFLYADLQNNCIEWSEPFWKQLLNVWCIAIGGELLTGLIVNRLLGLNVWDYSNQFLNLWGQICPLFALLFVPLCAAAIIISDWVGYILRTDQTKPNYKLY